MKYNRHKFNAVQTIRDGMKFPSIKEANYYDFLKLEVREGRVFFFLRQVPFHLPGNVRVVVDFQVFNSDGTIDFIDVKGMKTDSFIRGKKMVEALYPVTIKAV